MTTVFCNGKLLLADHRRSVIATDREKSRTPTTAMEGRYSNDQVEKIVVPPALAHKGSKILAFASAGDVKMILMVRDMLCESPVDLIDSVRKSPQLREANISLSGVVSRLKMMPPMGECSCSVLLMDDLERVHLLTVNPDRLHTGDRGLSVRHQIGAPGEAYGIGSGFKKYQSISSYLKSEVSFEDKFMIALKLDPASSPGFSAFLGKSRIHYKKIQHDYQNRDKKLSAIFASIPEMMLMMGFSGVPTVNFQKKSITTNML